MEHPFSLWLEFEQYAGGYPGPKDDPLCDFCNAQVTVGDSLYAINIWTFAYVEKARQPEDNSKVATYLLPPDFLVVRLDRATIAHSIQELLSAGGLPDSWRVEQS